MTDDLIPDQSRLFSLDRDVTYLNCAFFSPLLSASQKAGMAGLNRKCEPWRMGAEMFFEECEQLRTIAGQMIGSDADHIAIVPAASYGIGTAAHNLKHHLSPGQHILLLAEEFPSNYYSWKAIAEEKGAEVRFAPIPDDGNWTQSVIDSLDGNTAIVSIPNCHWTDGTLLDLPAIRKAMGEPSVGGPYLVLDLTQSLGAYPFDVNAVKPDFMTSALYKWGLAPYGVGILYVADRFMDADPLEYNWVNRYRSEELTRLVEYCDDYQPGARRFDSGERSNPILLPMATVAFKQLLDWNVDRIHKTLADKNNYLASQIKSRGLPLTVANETHRAGHMIGLRSESRWSDALRQEMAEDKIYVSYRGPVMRVSPHLYNTHADMDRLVECLSHHLS